MRKEKIVRLANVAREAKYEARFFGGALKTTKNKFWNIAFNG